MMIPTNGGCSSLLTQQGSSPSAPDPHEVENLNAVATPDPSPLHHPTQHSPTPTQLLLQTASDLVHETARFAGAPTLHHCLPHSKSLPHLHPPMSRHPP